MAALNRRLIASLLLIYQRNRRKKLQLMQKITSILLHCEQRRNILTRNCLLQRNFAINGSFNKSQALDVDMT